MGTLPLTVTSAPPAGQPGLLTVTWTPVAGSAGYEFLLDGKRVANTWNPADSKVTFRIPDGGPHTVAVVALQTEAEGAVTVNQPAPADTYAALVGALTPPQFEHARQIVCTTPADVAAAVAKIQPGDWIDVRSVSFAGETVWNPQLSSYAKVTLDAGCRFLGVASQQDRPALYLPHPRFFQVLFAAGATVTNPVGGAGILAHGGDHLVVDGFHVAGVGSDGFSLFPATDGTDVQYCFLRGEIEGFCMSTVYDPHAEKGTGLHGMNLGDSAAHVFHHNQVAVYVHDPWTNPATGKQIGGGSVVELGSKATATSPHDNDLYLKGERLLFDAESQTAGNGVNFWGSGGPSAMRNNVFHVIEVDDMAGYGFHLSGTGGATGNTVQVGRASRCCQNPRYSGQSPWMRGPEIAYLDVQPAA